MLAGHFATAIAARQHAPGGSIAFYAVASQLPDLLWHAFHFVGLEPTPAANPMVISVDGGAPPMHYSHDLLPLVAWVGLTVLFGRLAFGAWRPGLVGGGLVLVHELTDLVSGYPHYLWGPDSLEVGWGLYLSAPYVAVAIELVFTVGVLAWVVATDRARSVRRSRATWASWVVVFGGGLAFMFGSADLSLVEAKPLYADTGYSRLVVHLHRELWRQERIEFFDKAGRLLKVLDNSQWKHRHGRFWRPMRIEMRNVQTKKRTVIESSTQMLDMARYTNKRTGKPRPNFTDKQFTTTSLTGKR